MTIYSTLEINEAHAHNLFNIQVRTQNPSVEGAGEKVLQIVSFLSNVEIPSAGACGGRLYMEPRNQEIETEMGKRDLNETLMDFFQVQ